MLFQLYTRAWRLHGPYAILFTIQMAQGFLERESESRNGTATFPTCKKADRWETLADSYQFPSSFTRRILIFSRINNIFLRVFLTHRCFAATAIVQIIYHCTILSPATWLLSSRRSVSQWLEECEVTRFERGLFTPTDVYESEK